MTTDNKIDTPETPETTEAAKPAAPAPEAEVEVKAEAEAEAEAADPLAALNAQIAGLQQDLLYAQAETQNVRRRAEKEVGDAHVYAVTKFARDMLSVGDNVARALAAIPASAREDEAMKGLIAGLEATERELLSVFERHGITRIAAIGLPLDPNHHQAMVEIPTSDAEPGTVVMEMAPGYKIKDRLLRAAMVGVAKAAE
jgi:molecular chaperone GrpE